MRPGPILAVLLVLIGVGEAGKKYDEANVDGRLDRMGKKFLFWVLVFIPIAILLANLTNPQR